MKIVLSVMAALEVFIWYLGYVFWQEQTIDIRIFDRHPVMAVVHLIAIPLIAYMKIKDYRRQAGES